MSIFQSELEAAFPASTDAAVILGVQQGVLLANAALENELFLATPVGRDLRGHLRRAAVLFRIHELCKAGDLPFEAFMDRMPRGGGHWVEIRSGNFRAHICRTDGPAAFPEDTPTRQDQRLSNQLDLFADNVVLLPGVEALANSYAWLTFGVDGPSLGHICWGMPKATRDEWLARVNVMERAARNATPTKEAEAPTAAMRLRFRDHIEESLQKGKEGDDAKTTE